MLTTEMQQVTRIKTFLGRSVVHKRFYMTRANRKYKQCVAKCITELDQNMHKDLLRPFLLQKQNINELYM